MLLSRVAEQLYWSARYLERAEDTARIVREHTNMFVDMPLSLQLSWEPLLAVTGSRERFDAAHLAADEAAVVGFLMAEASNPGSLASSVERARENLRSCREILPGSAWIVVNDLHRYVAANVSSGVARRNRARFCEHLLGEHQRFVGILLTMMSRDEAFTMLRLGRHLERADMATRVLDVWAAGLLDRSVPGSDVYEDLLWATVLRSLSALQMYQRHHRRADGSAGPLGFVLHAHDFPRSVRYCLLAVRDSVTTLPTAKAILPAVDSALETLAATDPEQLDASGVHRLADDLQLAIEAIDDRIAATCFRAPVPVAS